MDRSTVLGVRITRHVDGSTVLLDKQGLGALDTWMDRMCWGWGY